MTHADFLQASRSAATTQATAGGPRTRGGTNDAPERRFDAHSVLSDGGGFGTVSGRRAMLAYSTASADDDKKVAPCNIRGTSLFDCGLLVT